MMLAIVGRMYEFASRGSNLNTFMYTASRGSGVIVMNLWLLS